MAGVSIPRGVLDHLSLGIYRKSVEIIIIPGETSQSKRPLILPARFDEPR